MQNAANRRNQIGQTSFFRVIFHRFKKTLTFASGNALLSLSFSALSFIRLTRIKVTG